MIYSLGFQHLHQLTLDCDVVDVRKIQNPHLLLALDGTHQEVQDFVMASPNAAPALARGLQLIAEGEDVYFLCSRGKHRSVALAEILHKLTDVPVTHLSLKEEK